MKTKTKGIFRISSYNQLKWVVVIRVILGLGLLVKGIQFIKDKSIVRKVFTETTLLQDYFWLQTLIPWLNLICGFFIIIGVYTRLMCVIQIPITLGAVIFARQAIFAGDAELGLSIVFLVLLIFYLFVGGGDFAWDSMIKRENKND